MKNQIRVFAFLTLAVFAAVIPQSLRAESLSRAPVDQILAKFTLLLEKIETLSKTTSASRVLSDEDRKIFLDGVSALSIRNDKASGYSNLIEVSPNAISRSLIEFARSLRESHAPILMEQEGHWTFDVSTNERRTIYSVQIEFSTLNNNQDSSISFTASWISIGDKRRELFINDMSYRLDKSFLTAEN